MFLRLCNEVGESVIALKEERGVVGSGGRPSVFASPFSRHLGQVRVRRMPVLHVDHKPRIIFYASVASLQPVIEPAYGLITPLDARSEISIVRKRMVPRSDDRLDGCFGLRQHVRNVVAISVLQPADQETRNRDFAERTHPISPKGTIMLVF